MLLQPCCRRWPRMESRHCAAARGRSGIKMLQHGRRPEMERAARPDFRLIAAFVCVVVVYAIVLALVPTNYGGDTPDYLTIAERICRTSPDLGNYSYMRGYGYPAFICLFSAGLSHIDLVYYSQAFLFLAALFLACKELTVNWHLSALAMSAAAIPYYAYLQKLLVEDGFIASLVLIYLVFACKRQLTAAAAVAILLAATKLMFVFLFAHLLLLELLRRYEILRQPKFLASMAAIGAVSCFIAFLVLFPGLAYMVAFTRAMIEEVQIEPLLSKTDLKFECGGQAHSISFGALAFSPIKEYALFAPYGPLTERD